MADKIIRTRVDDSQLRTFADRAKTTFDGLRPSIESLGKEGDRVFEKMKRQMEQMRAGTRKSFEISETEEATLRRAINEVKYKEGSRMEESTSFIGGIQDRYKSYNKKINEDLYTRLDELEGKYGEKQRALDELLHPTATPSSVSESGSDKFFKSPLGNFLIRTTPAAFGSFLGNALGRVEAQFGGVRDTYSFAIQRESLKKQNLLSGVGMASGIAGAGLMMAASGPIGMIIGGLTSLLGPLITGVEKGKVEAGAQIQQRMLDALSSYIKPSRQLTRFTGWDINRALEYGVEQKDFYKVLGLDTTEGVSSQLSFLRNLRGGSRNLSESRGLMRATTYANIGEGEAGQLSRAVSYLSGNEGSPTSVLNLLIGSMKAGNFTNKEILSQLGEFAQNYASNAEKLYTKVGESTGENLNYAYSLGIEKGYAGNRLTQFTSGLINIGTDPLSRVMGYESIRRSPEVYSGMRGKTAFEWEALLDNPPPKVIKGFVEGVYKMSGGLKESLFRNLQSVFPEWTKSMVIDIGEDLITNRGQLSSKKLKAVERSGEEKAESLFSRNLVDQLTESQISINNKLIEGGLLIPQAFQKDIEKIAGDIGEFLNKFLHHGNSKPRGPFSEIITPDPEKSRAGDVGGPRSDAFEKRVRAIRNQ